MHVRFSPLAESDLEDIHRYIAEHNEAAAQRITDKIFLMLLQLESFPFLGRPGRIDGTREITIPGTNYFAVYTLPDEYHINVQRILHSARQFPPEENN